MKTVQKYSFLKFYLIIFFLLQCSKVDPITGEKVLIEPDPVKKARQAADAQGGLFGDLGKTNKSNNGKRSKSSCCCKR